MPPEKNPNRPSEVIYQVYPAAFYDSNSDGHGDLQGVIQKLDYIKSLNVDAIWISPFFLSPQGREGDGGYAVTNYRKINPDCGTMEDFEKLLEKAHKKGLRVYTDFVLCHTANDHEWFEKSRNREPGYENRYVWHNGHMHEGRRSPPNNWMSVFNGPAWTFDDKRQQYYLHHFNTSQPALNLNDRGVQDAILGEMKFWLDKGVDGLRLDALPFANYSPDMQDNPWMNGGWEPGRERWDKQYFQHSMCQPQTVELVARIRKLLDSYPTRKTALGEVIAGREGGTQSMKVAAEYLDPEKGLHTCYTEGLIKFWYKYPTAGALKDLIKESVRLSPDGGFCNNPSNHDFPRAATRMTADAPEELRGTIIRQLMALNVSLPGSLCLYQGEELGLPQARIPEDIPHDKIRDLVDSRCRDGARTPIPWETMEKNAGFSTSDTPYLPVPESHYPRSVDLQEPESESMLNFTRRTLLERKINPAMSRGKTVLLDTPEPLLAFLRQTGDQTILFAYNMSQRSISFKPSDYLDEGTLRKLKIRPAMTISLGAYDYSRYGLVPLHDISVQAAAEANPPAEATNDNAAGKSKKIFAADILVVDHLIPADQTAKLAAEHKLNPDEKVIIDQMANQRLLDATPVPDIRFGGSTAATLWTLKKLMGDKVAVNYMGLVSDDAQGRIVKRALQEARINLLTEKWPDGEKQETSVSHIIRFPGGQNTILTYPGTGVEGLKKLLRKNPDLLEQSIRDNDVVFLPGSLTEKYGQTFTDEMLRLRWIHRKELVLSLPTHANFGSTDAQTFRGLIPSANVVMGNDVEFCRICGIKTSRPVTADQIRRVTDEIQEAFRERVLEKNGMPCDKEQVAFIACGNKNALLVTADKIIEIPAVNVSQRNNLLGAGATAFAGFLAGYMKGLDHKTSATIAMALAAEKIEQETPTRNLEDPQRSLEKALLRKSLSAVADDYRGGGGGAVGAAAARR